mmetsp:Transcript_25996/g.77058  ORF Transcript_25996/g.77058 Transcript_25996/m.77058 type:complete len:285 (-) Transcript_25996:872-1726(-)
MGVDEADSEAGVAAKRCMHCVVRQDLAVDAVARRGWDGADHVGGVDVLDVRVGERLLQLRPQVHADVLEDGVARRVLAARTVVQNVLAGTLRDTHHAVALLVHHLVQVGHEAGGSVELERDLRDEHRVHHAGRHRGLHRDEARLAAHELDQADAAARRAGLYLCSQQRALRLLDRGVEAKAFVDEQDVVVDRLGHADDAAADLVLLAHRVDGVGARIAAVSTDDKQHVNAPHVDALDNLLDVGAATRRPQDGAPLKLDPVDVLCRQHNRLDVGVVKAPEAVADA